MTRMRLPKWSQVKVGEFVHAVRTATAAVISLLVARLFKLPESYWAAITTMIVMQSTLGASLTISRQRLAGTALGAATGAIFAAIAVKSVAAYGAGILICGFVGSLLQMERSAFRYAGITLTIVMVIGHTEPAWTVAIHRFVEISIGIATGLVLTAVWPEESSANR